VRRCSLEKLLFSEYALPGPGEEKEGAAEKVKKKE
jgi:hypothetical protein